MQRKVKRVKTKLPAIHKFTVEKTPEGGWSIFLTVKIDLDEKELHEAIMEWVEKLKQEYGEE